MGDSLSYLDLSKLEISLNDKERHTCNNKTKKPHQKSAEIKVKLIHKYNMRGREVGKTPYLFVLFRFCL